MIMAYDHYFAPQTLLSPLYLILYHVCIVDSMFVLLDLLGYVDSVRSEANFLSIGLRTVQI